MNETKNKKVTINDIAQEAGVAKSTVSRYLNDGYVKAETRDKIKSVIDKYQYEPNMAASALKNKNTKTIGIVVPTISSTVASRMIESMEEKLKKEGYTPLIIDTNHDIHREVSAMEYFRSINVEGIILIATNISLMHQRLVHESDIPVLIVAQHFKNGASIIYDDYRAGKEIGEIVGKKGHQSVLYLGVNRIDEAVGVQRRKGVLKGLEENGVPRIHTRETDFSFSKTRKIIHHYLEDHNPSCIIAATDQLALAAYKEISEKGLRVPEDISLVGFGGYEVSQLITPSLFSVRFDNELAGAMAAKTILDMIKKEPVSTTQIIGYNIVPGGSLAEYKSK